MNLKLFVKTNKLLLFRNSGAFYHTNMSYNVSGHVGRKTHTNTSQINLNKTGAPTQTFDEALNNKDLDVKSLHLNAKGDYTVVFKSKSGKGEQTFANVKESKIPDRFFSKLR
ncbi:hypothetical protein ABK040_015482 [Willaertia magna]